ncbi:hypothetical protein GBA52_010810 [Prunus armeniaca]|nr:hypothetical protein GBA52_010810 [Prunus armeniaca]
MSGCLNLTSVNCAQALYRPAQAHRTANTLLIRLVQLTNDDWDNSLKCVGRVRIINFQLREGSTNGVDP